MQLIFTDFFLEKFNEICMIYYKFPYKIYKT